MSTSQFFTTARAEAVAAAGEFIKSGGFAAYPETHNDGYRVAVFAKRDDTKGFLTMSRADQLLKGTSWR